MRALQPCLSRHGDEDDEQDPILASLRRGGGGGGCGGSGSWSDGHPAGNSADFGGYGGVRPERMHHGRLNMHTRKTLSP